MIIFAMITLVINSLAVAEERVVLSDKVEALPQVLKQLQAASGIQLSPDTVQKTQGYFNQYTYETVYHMDEAHVVWRLMAALLASGAYDLYEAMLDSGYKMDKTLLEAIGFQWGTPSSRPMNAAERRILDTGHAIQGWGRGSYAEERLLCPWVFDYWDAFLENNPQKEKWDAWWPLPHIPALTLQAYNFTPYLPDEQRDFLLTRMALESPYPLRAEVTQDVLKVVTNPVLRVQLKKNLHPMTFPKPDPRFMKVIESFKHLPVDQQPVLSRTLSPELNTKILRVNQLWRALKQHSGSIQLSSTTADRGVIDDFKKKYIPDPEGYGIGKLLGLDFQNIGRAYVHNFLLQTDLFQRLTPDHMKEAIRHPDGGMALFRASNSVFGPTTLITIGQALEYGIPLLGYSATQGFSYQPKTLEEMKVSWNKRKEQNPHLGLDEALPSYVESRMDEMNQSIQRAMSLINTENVEKNIDHLLKVLEDTVQQCNLHLPAIPPADMIQPLTQTTDLQRYAIHLWHRIESYLLQKPFDFYNPTTNDDLQNIHQSQLRDINDDWIFLQVWADFVGYDAPQVASNRNRHIPELLKHLSSFPTIDDHYFDPFHAVDMMKNTSIQRGWIHSESLRSIIKQHHIPFIHHIRHTLNDKEREVFKSYVYGHAGYFVPKRPTTSRESIHKKYPTLKDKVCLSYKASKMSHISENSESMFMYGEIPTVRTGLALYRSLYFEPQTPEEEHILRQALLVFIPRLEYWLQSRMNDGRNNFYVTVAGSEINGQPSQSFWLLDTETG